MRFGRGDFETEGGCEDLDGRYTARRLEHGGLEGAILRIERAERTEC